MMKRSFPTALPSIVALIGALVALSGALPLLFNLVSNTTPKLPTGESHLSRDIENLKTGLGTQQKSLEAISSRLEAITSANTQSPAEVQIASLRAELASTAKRIDGLDSAILESPTKALTIPLLRQDLENTKASYQRQIESSNKEIDRIYDQNKWFIGLMVSMAVGLIGLAISNFMQVRGKD